MPWKGEIFLNSLIKRVCLKLRYRRASKWPFKWSFVLPAYIEIGPYLWLGIWPCKRVMSDFYWCLVNRRYCYWILWLIQSFVISRKVLAKISDLNDWQYSVWSKNVLQIFLLLIDFIKNWMLKNSETCDFCTFINLLNDDAWSPTKEVTQ